MTLFVLGDSISAGVGATLPSSLGYAALLHRNSAGSWPQQRDLDLTTLRPQLRFRSLAESGFTSAEVLQRLRSRVGEVLREPPLEPAIVVMTAGGNDLKNALWEQGLAAMDNLHGMLAGAPLAQTLRNLTRIVRILQHPQLFPHGVSIYLANVYDPSDGTETATLPWGTVVLPGLAAALQTWHRRYADLCASAGVHLIDALQAFRGHGIAAGPGQSWMRDWLHPNDRGHHELRRLFYQAITQGTP